MKQTRTILPDIEREKTLLRDGAYCKLCLYLNNIEVPGADFDHAFVLGNNGKRLKEVLNQAWNINVLCRKHHELSQWPVDKEGFEMRLLLMKWAKFRAKRLPRLKLMYPTIQNLYTQKRAFVIQRHGKLKWVT